MSFFTDGWENNFKIWNGSFSRLSKILILGLKVQLNLLSSLSLSLSLIYCSLLFLNAPFLKNSLPFFFFGRSCTLFLLMAFSPRLLFYLSYFFSRYLLLLSIPVSSRTWYQVFIELHVVDCDVAHYSTVNTCCSVRFSTLLNRKDLNRRFPGKMQHRTLDVCCSKTEFRPVVVWDKHSYEGRYFSDQTQMHSSLPRIMRRLTYHKWLCCQNPKHNIDFIGYAIAVLREQRFVAAREAELSRLKCISCLEETELKIAWWSLE